MEPQSLTEMSKEVHQPKEGQEVLHLLIPGILKTTDDRVEAPHENGIPIQETVESLI